MSYNKDILRVVCVTVVIITWISGVTVKVYVADMERETIIEPPVSIRAYLVQTVEEFKNLVAQVSI